MATGSQTALQNRIRTGSFRRCGILAKKEVIGDGAKMVGSETGVASTLVGSKRFQTVAAKSSFSRTTPADRSTTPATSRNVPSHRRGNQYQNERLDPERRNPLDSTNDRRPFVTKTATTTAQQQRRSGPTNPIAVGPKVIVSSSRIPRLNVITQHRAAVNSGPSPDSSGTIMDPNDSSLDLSQIGRNRSTSSSSTGSIVARPSGLLPPGSIISAKLAAAHQLGVRARTSTIASSVSFQQKAPNAKSKLPVATVGKQRPDCRSTRSLPSEGRTNKAAHAASVVNTTKRVSSQQANNSSGRMKSAVRPVPASKSVLQRIPHKTQCMMTAVDCRSVSTEKANNSAVGLEEEKKKNQEEEKEKENVQEEEGGLECRSAFARGRGEMCRGSQGRQEGSSLSDPRITPPDEVDHQHQHLGNAIIKDSLLSCSAKSEETSAASATCGLPSFHSNEVFVHQSVIRCNSDSMERPIDEPSTDWIVRINIPAAESCELLTRLECERQSIRGSTTCLTSVPPAADVELMELLERDLLLTDQPPPPPDEEMVENPQRSLSLPKSFLATKYGLTGLKAALPSVRFPWRRAAAEGNRVTTSQSQAASSHHHAETGSGTPHNSLPPTGTTAPASTLTAAARRPPGSSSTSRSARRFKSTSSPVFIDDDERVNRSHSAWDLASRPWSHFGEMSVSGSQSDLVETDSITEAQAESRDSTTPPTSNSSTLRKFRKSFSLRLSRRSSQDDTNNEEDQDGESEQTSPKFRFGPLVWRASRERNNKKGITNKAVRNAKCNSGDSGVQMETTSPPSDSTETNVRRTHSDLGGEAVIVAALRSTQTWSQASVVQENSKHRSRKLTRHLAKAHLRRSASQPMVVNPNRSDGPSEEDAGLCLSEDDNLSDCGNNPQAENEAVRYNAATEGILAIALWDHNAIEAEELSLQSGDVVHILDLSDPNWWWAARGQQYGWLPASYVQLCEQPFHRQQGLAQGQKFARTLTPSGMAALQHSVRANVINELVTAERDYVKLLSDLVDGYLKPMKNRPDLFTHQRIQSIFGNLEDLYKFQKNFLVDLEHSLNWNALEDSVVGGCFLQHIQEFAIYATYCNNQDRAAAEMQLMCDDLRYLRFFEACRLLRRMIRLPLEAFLLSPVQKICKYPLQLAELLKHTPDDHPDRRLVSLALDSMRSVAYLVNESKRRAEMQQFLAQWQSGVDHWMGSDITTFNTRLVHQGELFKISSNGWTREVTLFLFDKELVICKKELIKRNSLVYKDRLSVEDIEVLEPLAVVDVRPHSFQLRSFSRAKAYLLYCRSAQDKNQWVSAIQHLQQHHSSDWHLLATAPTMTIGRQKIPNKRSKVKHNPALTLTLEEAHLTLEGRDLPLNKRKI